MGKGLSRSLGKGSPAVQEIIKQTVAVRALAINVDGASGNGFGSAVLGDIPEGNILFLGAIAYLKFTKTAGATGVTATFDGSYSVGSAPTADATLSGSEIDIIPASTISAATAGVTALTRGANATQVMLDNTDGSLELNLNLVINDASISANTQGLTVDGYVQLLYSVMGDD